MSHNQTYGLGSPKFSSSRASSGFFSKALSVAYLLFSVFLQTGHAQQDVNIAASKPTQQSSTGFGGSASRAADGSTNGLWNNGSVSHTDAQAEPWWQVDLGEVTDISSISVWNRTDCCSDRLSNFHVFVSNVPYQGVSVSASLSQVGVDSFFTAGIASTQTAININRSGRYIRVQLAGTNALSLAEVEVFSTPRFDKSGNWSPVFNWPLIAAHSVVDRFGKVMTFGSTAGGLQGGHTIYDVWDPSQGIGSSSHVTLPNTTQSDLFCAAFVTDTFTGDILTFGGDVRNNNGNNNNLINRYNPASSLMSDFSQMAYPRWYPTSTVMSDGSIVLEGGILLNQQTAIITPEVYKNGEGWRSLFGATSAQAYDGGVENRWFYPRSFLAPDGSLFAISGTQVYNLDITGNGSVSFHAPFTGSNRGVTNNAVMYQPGKILQVGGGGYVVAPSVSGSREASIVDINQSAPLVTPTTSMAFGRHWANATITPDGKVIVTGGSETGNQLQGVAYAAEEWDPDTGLWTTLAAAAVPRLYHSTAILLPDATILAAGGGVPGPVDNLNAEIFYPPYLYDTNSNLAPRPAWGSVQDTVHLGQQIVAPLVTADTIDRVTLIKTGAVTHSFDFSQRFIELTFNQEQSNLTIDAPSDSNIASPGYYYLFAINDQGVPSEAKIIHIPVGSYTPSLCPVKSNVALQGIASQSSNLEPNIYLASSGNNITTGDFTHTTSTDSNASWTLDLFAPQRMETITLHNRDNCCQARFRDITVSIENAVGAEVYNSGLLNPENVLGNPRQLNITLPIGLVGSKVIVHRTSDPDNSGGPFGGLDNQNVLSLGEVVIEGCAAPVVSVPTPPNVTNPGDQTSTVNLSVSVQIDAFDINGDSLTYSAIGLPAGSSIDSVTGLIHGIPTVIGGGLVTVSVSDGIHIPEEVSFNWEVLEAPLACSITENVSLQGVASQSSNYAPGSYLAANGNNVTTGDFTHTASTDSNAAWSIDLLAPRLLENITLHNRDDCCQSRLRDITVSIEDGVGNEVYNSGLLNPENILGSPGQLNISLPAGLVGSKVTVRRTPDFDNSGGVSTSLDNQNVLSLGEVIVEGCAAPVLPTPPSITNPGNQSSSVNLNASLQIDAFDINGDSLTYSATGLPAGLSVDSATGLIQGIPTAIGGSLVTISVSDGIHIPEEVSFNWEVLEAPLACSITENVSLQGVASQSSNYAPGSYLAENGNNVTTGDFTHTAITDSNATWAMDLLAPRLLETITLHNRDNCCQSRLRDITVSVEDASGNEVYNSGLLNPENVLGGPGQLNISLPAGLVGSMVIVRRAPDFDNSGGASNSPDEQNVLALGEVQVMGCAL